jgi:hypothetical protein
MVRQIDVPDRGKVFTFNVQELFLPHSAHGGSGFQPFFDLERGRAGIEVSQLLCQPQVSQVLW